MGTSLLVQSWQQRHQGDINDKNVCFNIDVKQNVCERVCEVSLHI